MITMQDPAQQQQPPPQPVVTVQPEVNQGHTNAGFPQGSNTTTSTVVMINQPVFAPRHWSSGLFGCFDDFSSCLLGCFCPMFLLIDISNHLGESGCFPYCCPGALLGLRIKLRLEQKIEGSLCNDYSIVSCCPLCALCQLSREIKHVGRYTA